MIHRFHQQRFQEATLYSAITHVVFSSVKKLFNSSHGGEWSSFVKQIYFRLAGSQQGMKEFIVHEYCSQMKMNTAFLHSLLRASLSQGNEGLEFCSCVKLTQTRKNPDQKTVFGVGQLFVAGAAQILRSYGWFLIVHGQTEQLESNMLRLKANWLMIGLS